MIMMAPPFEDTAEDDAIWERMPEALQEEYNAMPLESGPCKWLDVATRRCRHYEHRPMICRDFEPGCDVCLEDRERELPNTATGK